MKLKKACDFQLNSCELPRKSILLPKLINKSSEFLTPPSSASPSPIKSTTTMSQLFTDKEEEEVEDPIGRLFICKYCFKLADKPVVLPCGIIICASEAFRFKFCTYCLNEHLDDYKCNETINTLIKLGIHKLKLDNAKLLYSINDNKSNNNDTKIDSQIITKPNKPSSITCFYMFIQTLDLNRQFYMKSKEYYTETSPLSANYTEVCKSISFEPLNNQSNNSQLGKCLSCLINNKYKMNLTKNEMNNTCHQESNCFHCIYARDNGSDPDIPFFLQITKQYENNQEITELIEVSVNEKTKFKYKLWSVFAYNDYNINECEYHQFFGPKTNGQWYKYEFGRINKSCLKDAIDLLKSKNLKYMLIYIKVN